MKPVSYFSYIAMVLALPLLLGSCAKTQTNAAKSDLTAKIQDTTDTYHKTRGKKSEKDALPEERLEAMAQVAMQSGDYEASLINLLEILRTNPERYDLHYKVGVLFLLKGQSEAARNELALVLVHRPDMLQAHEALGMVHLQEKKYPQAIEEFRTVLAQDPRHVEARHLLGTTYLEMGQPAKAVVELKRVLAQERRHLPSYAALGHAFNEMKDYRQAISTLKQGLSLDQKNQKLNHYLGMALAGEKRYNEALEAFMKSGDEAQAYNNIGVHYFVAGQYEEAAKCFQRAIELRPVFYSEAKTNLQRALERLHQTRNNDG